MVPRSGFSRFLLITLGITGLYLALDQIWLALTPTLAPFFSARAEAVWSDEAVEVARASRDADRRLPPASRAAAYRLGFEVGYCSNLLGSVALSPPEVQAKLQTLVDPRLAAARDLAQTFGMTSGVNAVLLVPVTNADQFGRMSERVDADEIGLAARIEQAASRRHRHLLLLGMHSGISAALADVMGGRAFSPVRAYIGRHATLAGVPASAWEPVARVPDGATPQEQITAYEAALARLDEAVSQLGALP